MLCQNCHQRPASIHLYLNNNGENREIALCEDCYQLLKNENGSANMNNFFSSFNDLLGSLGGSTQDFDQPRDNSPKKNKANNGSDSLLNQYGIDLTALAKQGKIDPVVGRDKEIARVIEILNRRTKNNPVLIGEAGVGKTAVVEGLAQQIIDGSVPAKLQNKKIISLNMVSLVQGTSLRGQFEQRMQQLIKELESDPNIILFIDEIHELVNAGNAEGGMDAGNIIKPALARGDFQLVGATTIKEYRQIEKDSALARRFQPVEVKEPSIEETIKILQGIKKKYEDYHHVTYTDQAIVSAVTLSSRYIQDRFLPDKAIDLLDEAGSRMNLTIPYVDDAKLKDRVGFNKSGRPIGSFLFVGPTGVGKTELAKQLAKQMFGTEKSMIRFDMSEYMEQYSVSKLIGSAPGYVGYEEAGQLTEKVRHNPYSLILFDEIEKAHPDVLHLFLQILDDGHLTDSQGRTVSFKDTIIIMTSNAGQGIKSASVGFSAENNHNEQFKKVLGQYFKPEFLNRLDDIVEFEPLSKESLIQIVDLMLDKTNEMIKDQDLHINVTPEAKDLLVEKGYDPDMGARPLRRVIQAMIEDKVADYKLDHPTAKNLTAKRHENDIIIVEDNQ